MPWRNTISNNFCLFNILVAWEPGTDVNFLLNFFSSHVGSSVTKQHLKHTCFTKQLTENATFTDARSGQFIYCLTDFLDINTKQSGKINANIRFESIIFS